MLVFIFWLSSNIDILHIATSGDFRVLTLKRNKVGCTIWLPIIWWKHKSGADLLLGWDYAQVGYFTIKIATITRSKHKNIFSVASLKAGIGELMLLLFGKLLMIMIKVSTRIILCHFILMNIKYRTMVLDMAFDYWCRQRPIRWKWLPWRGWNTSQARIFSPIRPDSITSKIDGGRIPF